MVGVKLSKVLNDLGGTLLEVAYGRVEQTSAISSVVIHDPSEESAVPSRGLVLGVGVRGVEETVRLLERLRGQAGAPVVRSPVPADERLNAAAEQCGVVLHGAVPGASWMQLAAMIRSVLAQGEAVSQQTEAVGGGLSGDLFSLANAIAAQLDAPVTIEDRNSLLLAFSGHRQDADPARVETVLGRQVPRHYTELLTRREVFRELYRSERPIFVGEVDLGDGTTALPRAAVHASCSVSPATAPASTGARRWRAAAD